MLNLRVKNRSLMLISVIYFLLIFTIGCSVKDDKHKDTELIEDTNYTFIQLIKEKKLENFEIPMRNIKKHKKLSNWVLILVFGGLTVFKVILDC